MDSLRRLKPFARAGWARNAALISLIVSLPACEVEGPFMGLTQSPGTANASYEADAPGQFVEPFDGQPLGAVPAGWSVIWNDEDADWFADERSGRVVLVDDSESDGRRTIVWEEAGDLVNPDILVLTRVPATFDASQQWIAARASGGAGEETGYAFQVRNDAVRIARYDSGTLTTLGDHEELGFDRDPERWYWMRFLLEDWLLRGKIWPDGEEEPELWTIVREDAVLTDAGGVGVGRFISSGEALFDYFGLSVGGEPLPRP